VAKSLAAHLVAFELPACIRMEYLALQSVGCLQVSPYVNQACRQYPYQPAGEGVCDLTNDVCSSLQETIF
jgi:hypothetical protein